VSNSKVRCGLRGAVARFHPGICEERRDTRGFSLRKRISDLGLTVEGAIAFAEWLVDDGARRAKGMEQAKRDMGDCRANRRQENGRPAFGCHQFA
jgi:hypothetical protein